MRNLIRSLCGAISLLMIIVSIVSPARAALPAETPPDAVAFSIPTAGNGVARLAAYQNYIYFTEAANTKIGRIDINTGAFEEIDTAQVVEPNGTPPYDIKVASDGHVWYTSPDDNSICEIIWGGEYAITEYFMNTAASAPTFLHLDANGDVYATEADGNNIIFLDTSTGNQTEYAIPTPAATPEGIDLDAAGNVWFTEYSADKIGKMTPAGVFTEYDLLPTMGPWDIVYNSADGYLWFSESTGNAVGWINSQNGSVTSVDTSQYTTIPFGGTIDSNGAVWGSDHGRNQIGSYDRVSGATSYTISSGNLGLNGMAEDGNGNIWVAGSDAGKLYRFDRSVPVIDEINVSGGQTLSGTSSITTQATDNTSVTNIEYYVDGELKVSSSSGAAQTAQVAGLKVAEGTNTFSYDSDTNQISNGEHTLAIYAYDAAGNFDSASYKININNEVLPETGAYEGSTIKKVMREIVELPIYQS